MDVATGQRNKELLPHVNIGLRQVAYSPDGGRVFAGSEAHVRLWDVDQRVALGPPIPVVGVPPGQPFSPDGRWIACQVGGHQMQIYSAATGAAAGPPLRRDRPGHRLPVQSGLPVAADRVRGRDGPGCGACWPTGRGGRRSPSGTG